MSMKDLFNSVKREGYVVKPLDYYLESKANGTDNDRAPDVNAPSAAGRCIRANYYARTGEYTDGSINAKTQRIFDNGTHVHLRLQKYLSDMGILICDEVPVINEEYNIQGHTDGLLQLSPNEVGILEIKSINDGQFTKLRDAKPEHKCQGLVYLFCTEERRKALRGKYDSLNDYYADCEGREKYFSQFYQHFEDGSKFSREEKIKMQVELNMVCDDILLTTSKPVTKVIFLYENKNNQELKEFCVTTEDSKSRDILDSVLGGYTKLNECVEKGTVPERQSTRNSEQCKWCDYFNTCWVV